MSSDPKNNDVTEYERQRALLDAAISKKVPLEWEGSVLSGTLLSAIAAGWAHSRVNKEWPTVDGREVSRDDCITASEFFNACPRELFFKKRSTVAPSGDIEQEWAGVAERGHTFEAWAVDRITGGLDPATTALLGHTWQQRTFYRAQYHKDAYHFYLSGTPDGWLDVLVEGHPAGRFVVDFKSVDPRSQLYGQKFPREKHVAQLALNAWLLTIWAENFARDYPKYYDRYGVELAPTASGASLHVDMGVIVYGDANDYARLRIDTVHLDANEKRRAVMAATDLGKKVFSTTARSVNDIEANGVETGACRFCEYRHACTRGAEYKDPWAKKEHFVMPQTIVAPPVPNLFIKNLTPEMPAPHNHYQVGPNLFMKKTDAPVAPAGETEAPVAPTGDTPKEQPDVKMFLKLALEIVNQRGIIKDMETNKDDKTKLLTSLMEQHNYTSLRLPIPGGDLYVTLTEVAGRKTLDVEAYEKATGVSAAPFYKQSKPSVRLDIKLK